MNQSIISIRYAKALMLTGTGNQCLDELKADMELISATISDNPLFRQILDNPVIKPQQKRLIMSELLEKRIHPLSLNFIYLLIRNRRETQLADIARDFVAMYEKSKGIMRAHVVSAADLDETSKKRLRQQLNVLFKAEVQMTAGTNPELIGGFVLRAGDRQYDASLATALKRMQKTLTV